MAGTQGSTGHVAKSPAKSPGKKGGRPVTWVGGGGLSYQSVAQKGVPELRAIFFQVFGHPTASNNSTWLRRKLSEPSDENVGRGRSAMIRKRDQKAALWAAAPKLGGPPLNNTDDNNNDSNKSADTAEDYLLKSAPKSNNSSPRKRNSLDGSADSMADSTTCMDSMGLRAVRRKVSETGSVDSFEVTRKQDPALAAIIATLKHLSGPGFGPGGPSTVEVFWPDHSTGEGSWWPAKVVKVHPRKGKCRVLYDTSESEELDLMSILQSKHLRLVKCPFPEVENAQADMLNRQKQLGPGEQDCPCLVPKSVQNMASAVVAKAEPTVIYFGPHQQQQQPLTVCDDENDAEQQALNDLQGIMQDPTDCTTLPCLSPETSVQDEDEDSKEWLPEVKDFLMPSKPSVEENNMRSKVKREQAEESSNCPSEATSMEAFMYNPLKQSGGSSTEVTVSDEPFSPTGSVQSSQQINNFGAVPLSVVQLACGLGAGPASLALPTSVASEHNKQPEAPSSDALSKALDEQVEALKKKICEKIQLRMQMNQQEQHQQQEAGYQMALSALMPTSIMQSGHGLYCCAPAPLGAVMALPQGSQDTSQYSAMMAATGSHYPAQSAPAPIMAAPPTAADFSSFTSPSNAGSSALFI